MEFITLQFQTPQQFLGFRSQLKKEKISSNIANLTIKTNYTEDEIQQAITHFGAVIIQEWKRGKD